jgi:hypothetical protein
MLSTGACRTGTKPRARTRPELSGERRKKIGAYWPDQHCVVWRKDFHGQPLSGAVSHSERQLEVDSFGGKRSDGDVRRALLAITCPPRACGRRVPRSRHRPPDMMEG